MEQEHEKEWEYDEGIQKNKMSSEITGRYDADRNVSGCTDPFHDCHSYWRRVAVVKEAYKKTTQKAEAQQVLATTAELITDVYPRHRKCGRRNQWSGVFNGENGIWMRLGAVPYQEADGTQEENTNKAGIYKVFIADNGQETRVPLLSDGAMAKRFYTDFNVDQYSYEDGCFTVKDINVYYKADAKRSDKVPMAHLDQLTVHAVNLEGLN